MDAPATPVETIKVDLREFETTILLPGFGRDPADTGRVVSKALEICPAHALHLKKLVVQRGCLELAGEYDPKAIPDHKQVQATIMKVGAELARTLRAPSSTAHGLPRSAEG